MDNNHQWVSEPLRTIYIIIGVFSLIIGFIGIFVPLLPTTPFVLLSAYLFQRSSKKFHEWLIHHPQLGASIVAWNEKGIINRRSKKIATFGLIGSLIFVLFFKHIPLWLKGITFVSFLGILYFIWSRPEA